jgi:hypothetical protein
MQDLTEEIISKLKSEHGEICAVSVAGQTLVFRKPTPPEYDRWFDGYSGSEKSKRSRELAVSTIVWPSRQALDEAIKARPGCLTSVLDTEIIKLAGAGAEDCKSVKL